MEERQEETHASHRLISKVNAITTVAIPKQKDSSEVPLK
jgi:hypothetical protein